MTTFKDLGINEKLLQKIIEKGYKNPSEIQIGVIPVLLNGEDDVIGQAQTGSGKTAAFALPILQRIDVNKNNIQALILAPTRELAIQIANEFKSFSDTVKLQLLYGGQNISKEISGLKNNPHIVIGTTGRILDHLENRKTLKLNSLKYLILDEADEMLNMGFIDDIEKIIKFTPKNKQILLFSATMPKQIKKLAMNYLKNPIEVKIKAKQLTNPNVIQKYYLIDKSSKFDALVRILETEPDFYGIVFCRTKAEVDEVSSRLVQFGYKAEGLHGDISQNLREKTLGRFKNQAIKILVATDVAARGIHVNNLTHVINYTLPDNPETYTHRIGRTGRAGNQGEAISLVTRNQLKNIKLIENITKAKIKAEKLPQPEELIKFKRLRLTNRIKKLIEENNLQYLDLAKDLLGLGNAEEILAAVLQEAFGNEYSVVHYKKIKTNKPSSQIRLFVAKGRKDGIKNPPSLIKFLEKQIGKRLGDVGDIDIKDNFSFLNVSEDDAKFILEKFKNKTGTSIVMKAKKRK